jgi:uncharacterized protein YndB with AHSA1/START domain
MRPGRFRFGARPTACAHELRRANQHTLSDSIRLAAPPDKVWDLITTAARITEWYDTWDTVEHATGDERLRVGTSFD